jgi:hypothetical protein
MWKTTKLGKEFNKKFAEKMKKILYDTQKMKEINESMGSKPKNN